VSPPFPGPRVDPDDPARLQAAEPLRDQPRVLLPLLDLRQHARSRRPIATPETVGCCDYRQKTPADQWGQSVDDTHDLADYEHMRRADRLILDTDGSLGACHAPCLPCGHGSQWNHVLSSLCQQRALQRLACAQAARWRTSVIK
jgi:hypothetical protein